jgi:hypothetical protein
MYSPERTIQFLQTRTLVVLLALLMGGVLLALPTNRALMAPASAPLTVINSNDSGAGSLRQAILDAAPGDTIDFSLSGAGMSPTNAATISPALSARF